MVGERNIADAVRAVGHLPRAVGIVLAGSLMGGEIKNAVTEVRARGIFVISLNMPGSTAAAADLIVTDRVQAGVMAVMAIAKTASFDIARQRGAATRPRAARLRPVCPGVSRDAAFA